MSHVQDVIDLYLYDLDVTDAQFRAVLLEAVEKDGADNPAALRHLAILNAFYAKGYNPGHSVKV